MPKKEKKELSEKLVMATELRDKAEKLIDRYPENLGHLDSSRIGFFWDTDSDPKGTLAKCHKVSDLMKATVSNAYDFIIIFYKKKFEDRTPAQLHICLFHELMHCGEDGNLVDHDVQDFVLVCATWGVLWASDDTVKDPLDMRIAIQTKPEDYFSDAEDSGE